MVTPEQANRYEVEAIDLARSLARSAGGDIGEFDEFFDEHGMECEMADAVSAIVKWPDPSIWSVIHLADYRASVLH